MTLFTILCDSREQKPWEFEGYPVETKTVTLATGDYTLPSFATYNEKQDTYYPDRAIERKSPDDFLSSLFQNRERFQQEIKRAGTWETPLYVVIEAPWSAFVGRYNRYTGEHGYRDVDPNRVKGTVNSWRDYFNVEWEFCTDRAAAEQFCFDALTTWHRM